jgi:tetratricopeptide (TPR) repeat protein
MPPVPTRLKMRCVHALLLLVLASGCSMFGDSGQKTSDEARNLLRQGDLPGGIAAFDKALKDSPKSVSAAIGASYGAYLQGDYARADQILAKAEEQAGKNVGEIKLRRALVAMKAGDLDKVRKEAQASGLATGKLFAAEVALADGERDTATALLNEARLSSDQAVSATAAGYLALMQDGDPLIQGLSEAEALWALGQRRVATRSVEEILRSLSDDNPRKSELLLIWAGRAAAAGEVQVASNLVEAVVYPPPNQNWRRIATQALVACADGDEAKCRGLLDGLEGAVPKAALLDARATAAILLAPKDSAGAARIVGQEPSVASARALLAAGNVDAARKIVPNGLFARFLNP